MNFNLSELIRNYSNSSGVPIASYSTLYGGKNKFNIPASKFGEFFNKYCDLAYDDEKADEGEGIPPTNLFLAESVENKTTLPLMGIFNFKFQVL
jgi:hypothetical protein